MHRSFSSFAVSIESFCSELGHSTSTRCKVTPLLSSSRVTQDQLPLHKQLVLILRCGQQHVLECRRWPTIQGKERSRLNTHSQEETQKGLHPSTMTNTSIASWQRRVRARGRIVGSLAQSARGSSSEEATSSKSSSNSPTGTHQKCRLNNNRFKALLCNLYQLSRSP